MYTSNVHVCISYMYIHRMRMFFTTVGRNPAKYYIAVVHWKPSSSGFSIIDLEKQAVNVHRLETSLLKPAIQFPKKMGTLAFVYQANYPSLRIDLMGFRIFFVWVGWMSNSWGKNWQSRQEPQKKGTAWEKGTREIHPWNSTWNLQMMVFHRNLLF